MRIKAGLSFLIFLIAFSATNRGASALPNADVTNNGVALSFPDTVTFSADISSSAPITSVVLEYGSEQQTCGEVTAKAFPEFQSSTSTRVEWTWDMRQSGSLPPGAAIWWRWRYTDSTGAEFVSDTQKIVWLDKIHNWQTISAGNLFLHYYDIQQDFAQVLLDAGIEGLRRNKDQAGLETQDEMNIYIYPNYEDMRDAVLFEPAWTGGQAYSDFNIVIMGLSNFDNEWNKKTVIHELTHLLVGHFTFSCIGTIPGWIEEGLAMYSEGELDADMQDLLERAAASDGLIRLRSLNGGFSELPEKANLSYAQSYSVVKFMIGTYGQPKMTDLLILLRDAEPIDDALIKVYGLDTDGLDSAWRESLQAPPLPASAQPTLMPTPTHIPTYVPVSGVPLATTPTPNSIPTTTFDNSGQTPSGPPLSLTISLVCMCLVLLLIFGVFALGFMARSDIAKAGKNE